MNWLSKLYKGLKYFANNKYKVKDGKQKIIGEVERLCFIFIG